MKKMRGELVTLGPLDIKTHAQGYFEASQDAEMHRFVGNSVPESVEEIKRQLEIYEELFLNWMIIDNKSGKVIGIIRFSKPEKDGLLLTAGESQRLCSAYWRKGHMKEAKKLLYPYVFGELGVDRLYADVWEGNENSIRSLEYYGYKRISTVSEVFSKTGKLTDKYIYALDKSDYLK